MNDRCFEGRERTLWDILSLFYVTLFVWTEAYVPPLLIRFSDFIVRFAPAS